MEKNVFYHFMLYGGTKKVDYVEPLEKSTMESRVVSS